MHYSDTDIRAVEVGRYIAERGVTVRKAASVFGVSKSTVHKDVTVRLKEANPALFRAVAEVLERNKSERHIRGGNATKMKYKGCLDKHIQIM